MRRNKYRRTQLSFFHKGPDNQKQCDAAIDIKRVGKEEISKWTPEEKQNLLKWLRTSRAVFEAYESEIIDSTKTVEAI